MSRIALPRHRFVPRILAAAALTLAGCVAAGPTAGPAQAQGRGEPIVLMNNKGGNVLQAISRREDLARSGRPVEVRGYCRSACTIYITLPNACLGPGATVGFHAPRIPGTTIVPPIVDQLMAQYYRGGILRKWQNEWRHSLEMSKISAAEYKRLDPEVRICK
ncbi:hypothetical protein [Paracoccus sp. Z118]|uniref:hypothetical protein n=1 Tax=Paracoccus sp. Z118 TaxID=2851017 RepID=UPI0020B8EF02|nr:hypothetical protein [Paracoccus sp. Z118]